MDGAALFAIIAAVGFGWQPMPDGSERYEYIVQVDEELAQTLASGKSIPIVGEVPEDIRPIGRVRVVIGSGDLPRERMVKQLKPVVAATMEKPELPADKSIVVRGQNAVGTPPYSRYGDALQQQVSQSAAAVTNAATEAWNGAASAPAPSSQALFDSAAASVQQSWNDNVAAPATNALNNASQNFQQQIGDSVQQGVNSAAAQLQQGAQNAAASLGDRTSSVINDLRNPLSRQPAQTGRDVRNQAAAAPLAAVAPPATGAAATNQPFGNNAAQPGTSWNPEPPATAPLSAGVQPPAPSVGGASEWNGDSQFPATQPLANQNGVPQNGNNSFVTPNNQVLPPTQYGQPPANSQPADNTWNNADNNMAGVQPPATNNNGAGAGAVASDPWRGVPDPRVSATPTGSTLPPDAQSPATQSPATQPPASFPLANEPQRPFGGAGATWSGDSPFPNTLPLASETGLAGSTLSPSQPGTPVINVDMMNQNPNRPLDDVAAGMGNSATTPATTASTGQNTPPAVMNRDPFGNTRTNQPATPNLAGAGQAGTLTTPTANPQANGAATGGRDNAFIALVAWVLLFGSAFGNLYLFWSYLDVRQKYRSLVRKTARAVGSRFSAA